LEVRGVDTHVTSGTLYATALIVEPRVSNVVEVRVKPYG
jgi:hypothetical protein